MASKKKTTRRKKRVNEKFDVKMTKDVAGSNQEVEQTVDASNPQAAIQKVQATDPRSVQDAESITVAKTKVGGRTKIKPNTQPQIEPNTVPTVESKKTKKKVLKKFMPKGYESANYPEPYSLGLPRGFAGLFEEVSSSVGEATLIHRHGRIYITAPTRDTMDRVVEALGKISKGKNDTMKSQAEIVIRGILAK